MKKAILFLVPLLLCISDPAQETAKRPPILGLGAVAINVTQREALKFYPTDLGLEGEWTLCGGGCKSYFPINSHQRLELVYGKPLLRSPDVGNLPKPVEVLNSKPTSCLVKVTFETSDIEALHRYLDSKGIHSSEVFSMDPDNENPQFTVEDPEGHHIGFIQFKGKDRYRSGGAVSDRLIHAGFVVHDRSAEEHFYIDILGFRPYWHGGATDDQTDWVCLQVPDGTDWVEFMLNVPPNADHRALGVKNHIALGVTDIHAAQQQLIKNGWNPTEEPKIGRSGKWQLNLYDPDGTRIEFMEFKPVQKPCCSEFTGPHPGPKE